MEWALTSRESRDVIGRYILWFNMEIQILGSAIQQLQLLLRGLRLVSRISHTLLRPTGPRQIFTWRRKERDPSIPGD